MIAHRATQIRQDVLKALIFVLAVKLAVSPHSPINAYIAVIVQAALGVLFFSLIPRYSIAAMLTAVISMLCSALQEILVLTLIFGMGLWSSIDQFVHKVNLKMQFLSNHLEFSASSWLIGLYVSLYVIGGILIGRLAINLTETLSKHSKKYDGVIDQFGDSSYLPARSRNRTIRFWGAISVFTIVVFIAPLLVVDVKDILYPIARTLVIIVLWFLLLRPAFLWLLNRFVSSRSFNFTEEIKSIQSKLPDLIAFARYAWERKKELNQNSFTGFISLYMYYAIYRA